ncbi:hypothetical protein [Clostridium thailandense]
MYYPDALIYELKGEFRKVGYKATEHFQVMKQFINNTEKMLDIIMNP